MARMLKSNKVRPEAEPERAGRRAGCRFDRGETERGFTLVELVVVMAIVGVVSAIGIVRYGRALARYRVESAAARLVSDLGRAQSLARTTGTGRVVKFKASGAWYAVLTADDVAQGQHGEVVLLGEDPYRVGMRVDGLPGSELYFDGRGEGNAGAIVVLSIGGIERGVIVEPNFGRAYVVGGN